MSSDRSALRQRVIQHLEFIYAEVEGVSDFESLADQLLNIMELDRHCLSPEPHKNLWDQSEIAMITYGDTIQKEGEKPLHTLDDFMNTYLKGAISSVHILPFFPWCTDDGFSVINFTRSPTLRSVCNAIHPPFTSAFW